MAATAALAQLTRFSLVHTLASLSILFFLALACGRPRHRFAWLPLEIASRKTTSARPATQGRQLHLTRCLHRVSPKQGGCGRPRSRLRPPIPEIPAAIAMSTRPGMSPSCSSCGYEEEDDEHAHSRRGWGGDRSGAPSL
jgi:hypothetical protein